MRHAKARRLARREGLGGVLAVFRAQPSALLTLWVGVVWLLAVASAIAERGHDPRGLLATMALDGLVLGALYAAMVSDRLVICEGGLLIGSLIPGVTPYRLRWPEIRVDTLTVIDPLGQAVKALGGRLRSSRRADRRSGAGLSLAGPSVDSARLGGLGWTFPGPADAVTGGHLWFFPCGRKRTPEVAAALVRALTPVVGPDAALLAARLRTPLRLSDDLAVARRQIPGFREVADEGHRHQVRR